MIGILAIGLASAELNTLQVPATHQLKGAGARGISTGEICDLGWGPDVIVRVGELHKDERYKVPERFRRQYSSTADPSLRRTEDLSSYRRHGPHCPTQTLRAVRFPEVIANHLRFSSSTFPNAQRLDIRTQHEWSVQWKRMAGKSRSRHSIPSIDFRREMVLIATMGARPSGGYRVVIEKVIDRPQDIQAVVRHLSPGPKCGAIGAITHPMDMVRIRASHKPVHWVVLEQLTDCP